DVVLRVMIFVSACHVVIGIAIGTSGEALGAVVYYAGFLFTAFASLVYVLAGVLSVRIGTPGAWYFLICASAVAISIVAAALAEVLVPNATMEHTRDRGRFGLLVEEVFFLLGIGARIVRIRKERLEAHFRAVAALQEKVALSAELHEAERAFEQARALAQTRRVALAHATHDLRQPLLSIGLSLQNLQHLEAAEREALERYLGYLEDIIDTHLCLSTEDDVAGGPGPKAETLEVGVVLEAVLEMFRAEAEAKGRRLRAVPTRLEIDADPVVTLRIASNFVANAVKHTVSGGVVMGARRRGVRVMTAVYDTGPGLTPDEIARLRRPGFRGQASTGSGLGLAVIDTLAKSQGLTVHIRSRLGHGSCFGSCVPVAVAAADR
ncbi:MAG: HAMP domain-containing sensor histidine kinase, partial [Pseudomonadota bacterium]